MFFFPTFMLKLYMAPTENVLKIAPEIIRIYGLSYLFLPLNIYSTYYFQSVMKPKIAFLVSILRGLVLCGILIFLMPIIFGKTAIWYVMLVTELIVSIFVIVNMLRLSSAKK